MEEEALALGNSCIRRAQIGEHNRPPETLILSPVSWRLLAVPMSRVNANKMLTRCLAPSSPLLCPAG